MRERIWNLLRKRAKVARSLGFFLRRGWGLGTRLHSYCAREGSLIEAISAYHGGFHPGEYKAVVDLNFFIVNIAIEILGHNSAEESVTLVRLSVSVGLPH